MRIAVVGLHFGAAFAPIYQKHPDVERVILCDRDQPLLHEVGDRLGIRPLAKVCLTSIHAIYRSERV